MLNSVKAITCVCSKHSFYKKSVSLTLSAKGSVIFDAFERLEGMSILRVKREDEFAPLKNADGEDSPDTARQLYINYMDRKKKGLV